MSGGRAALRRRMKRTPSKKREEEKIDAGLRRGITFILQHVLATTEDPLITFLSCSLPSAVVFAMEFFRGLFKDPKQEEAAKLVRYDCMFIVVIFLCCLYLFFFFFFYCILIHCFSLNADLNNHFPVENIRVLVSICSYSPFILYLIICMYTRMDASSYLIPKLSLTPKRNQGIIANSLFHHITLHHHSLHILH